MNTYEYISLPEIRDRVKIQLGILNDTSNDDFIDLKIMNASRSLLSQQNLIYTYATLDVIDYKAKLPCNYYRLMALVTNPLSGAPFIYSDYNFFQTSPFQSAPLGISFMVQDGYIMFPSTFDIDEVKLVYQALLQDDNGFPLYYLSHADYLTYAACYWMTMRDKDGMFKEYKLQMVKHKKAIYHNEAVDKMRLDKGNIKSIIQKVIPNRFTGMYVWNNNLVLG